MRKKPYTGVQVRRRSDRSGRWEVRWRDGLEKQRRKSFPSKETAEAHAAALKKERKEKGVAGLSGVDAAALRDFHTLQGALDGATIAQLLAVWERHKNEVLGGEKGLTLAMAVERYIERRKNEGLKGDSIGHVKKHLGRLTAFTGTEQALVAVTHESLIAWLDKLRDEQGFEPVTLRHHLKDTRAFFSRAIKEGWRTDNPADRVTPPKVEAWEVSVLTAEQGEKLFTSCKDDPISLRLALEAFGGLRYASAKRLKREHIRLDEHGMELPGALHKSQRRHYLEGQPDNLWAWIKRWWDVPAAWKMTERQILAAKSAAFAKAGVPHPHNVLRHSFCSHHIALHTDAAKTAVLLQHTSPTMLYKHYKGVSSKADAARWFSISPT